ncbi:MAG TPA: PDZ domain-containing protein [Gemmataceae bacterium]|nr:PDZ domain-containing protein [Gemmataceae bacterium]
MRFLRRFFVLAVFVASTSLAVAQPVSKDHLRDGPAILKVFRPVVAKASEATVRVSADGKAVAFGTIVDSSGLILTKWDEIRDRKRLICRLKDGTELEAKIVGVDKEYDLAMIKVEATSLPTIQWQDIKKALVGRWVASPGTGEDPLGVGVISVAKRKLVLGDQPPKNSNVNSGWLGVGLDDGGGKGAKIASIAPKSPAEKAGLKTNDLVIQVAGRKITGPEGLIDTVGRFKPGDEIALKVVRDEEDLDINVKLAPRPKELKGNPQETMGTKLNNRRGGFPNIIQHDTGLRPEFCGGPLVDLTGKAIGINIARAGRTETYAIPVDDIEKLLPKFKSGELAFKDLAVQIETPKVPEDVIFQKSLKLTESDMVDKKRPGFKAKRYMKAEEIKLTAGVTYTIEMQSADIDSYLILEDSSGTKVAEDDNSGNFPNAKLVFTPKSDGNYRIIATSFGSGETGSFNLSVRRKAAPSKDKK